MGLQQADREILRLNQEIAALPKRVAAIEEKLPPNSDRMSFGDA